MPVTAQPRATLDARLARERTWTRSSRSSRSAIEGTPRIELQIRLPPTAYSDTRLLATR